MSQQKNKYLNKTQVKELGFTNAMIDRFLPEPIERCNPYFKCAAPMLRWKAEDVERAMTTDEFKIDLEKANKRRQAAKKSCRHQKGKNPTYF